MRNTAGIAYSFHTVDCWCLNSFWLERKESGEEALNNVSDQGGMSDTSSDLRDTPLDNVMSMHVDCNYTNNVMSSSSGL